MAWYDMINDLLTGKADQDKDVLERDYLKLLSSDPYTYSGDYTPESMGDTAFGGISEDPTLRLAQMKALEGFQDIVDSDGITPQDANRLNQINMNAAQQEKAQRESILANARSRGISGSGIELMSQLQSQQEMANQRANQGLGVQAEAQNRVLDALTRTGSMGGQIRGQDYGIASDKASATDAINRFNTANRNEATRRNIDTRQGLSDRNVGTRMSGERDIYGSRSADVDRRRAKADALPYDIAGGLLTGGNPIKKVKSWLE